MIPLFSTSQIRSVDDYAINKLGIPGIVLMENAAIEIFNRSFQKVFQKKNIESIGFVCGKGNNGGDGFAVARHYANRGYKIIVIKLGKTSELSNDSKTNFHALENIAKSRNDILIINYKTTKDLKNLQNCDVIFDALLGSGAKGELREPYKTIVKYLNQIKSYKVSVDIPTGLDADSGYAESAFISDLTVTLAEFKTGLFIGEGVKYSGEVIKGNIGIDESYFDKYETLDFLIEPEDVFESLPIKDKTVHKYSSGRVLTIAGSGKLPGAAIMTSKSSFKVGAGASILAFPNSVRNFVHSNLSEVVVSSYEDSGKEFLSLNNVNELSPNINWADVVAIGPGLGREVETQKAVLEILRLRKNKKIVIDADAIYALSNGNYKKVNLKNMVLTPHHGEFANLVGVPLNELKKNLLTYGRKFTNEKLCYLVLKGAPSIIFTPNGVAYINTTGNPGMAKFGSGDVLTGVIAGFLAQQDDIESAVINSVYLHSLAADLLINKLTQFGITADDIIENLPKAIKFIRNSFV